MEVRKPKYRTGLEVNRRRCLECSGFKPSEINKCLLIDCVDWPGRFEMRPETAAKKGYLVNPYEVLAGDYDESHLKGTYRYIGAGPIWWELSIREIIKRFGLK